jgi:hypothetical protein
VCSGWKNCALLPKLHYACNWSLSNRFKINTVTIIGEVDMTAPASVPTGDQQVYPLWIRVILIIFALLDTLAGLVDLPNILQAQGVSVIRIALTPMIAAVALYFAIAGRLRHAIFAMGVLILMWWLCDLPSHAFTGLDLALHLFIYPLLAVAAIVLAVKAWMLGVAAILVCVPDIVALLIVLAVVAGVSGHLRRT